MVPFDNIYKNIGLLVMLRMFFLQSCDDVYIYIHTYIDIWNIKETRNKVNIYVRGNVLIKIKFYISS